MIVATAPGRCGMIGNPTDMYGGAVLSVSTRERARCVLAPADALEILAPDTGDRAILLSSEDLQRRGDALDVARAVLAHLRIEPDTARFSLTLSTEIPRQAGLAGSTALVVAILGALDRYLQRGMHPWEMAETARKIEARVLNIVCGFQDQHMAVFGGLNYMDFAGKESLEQHDDEPLATVEPLDRYILRWPENILLAHTGIRHNSGAVHRSPRQRWLNGEAAIVAAYRRIADLARLGKRAWLAGDWPTLGALMNENHALVADLGGSGPANDLLIEVARAAGAYGAKLAGAGGGGTILALTDDPLRVGQALREAGADSLWTPYPAPGLTVTEEE